MKKYLYLTKKEWVSPWTRGGVVPLYRASRYLSDERNGVMTPDEHLVDASTHDLNAFKGIIEIRGNSTVTFTDTIINGTLHKGSMHFDRKVEDGLVLCLANSKSIELSIKLGKIACVEILDIDFLKRHLDKQIGITSLMKECEYTDGHNRNHFLKSSLDAWQDEFRLFWPGADSVRVSIPSGIAKEVKFNKNQLK